MITPDLSARAPSPVRPALAGSATAIFERFEKKYLLPCEQTEYVLAVLGHCALRDPQYPVSLVTSVYFDTPELEAFWDSTDGEFNKSKVRLRWYGVPSGAGEAAAFVEVKSKEGFRSRKVRKQLLLPVSALHSPEPIGHRRLQGLLGELGYIPKGSLHPVVRISYQRYRFRDHPTRSSITYDSEISSEILLPGGPGRCETLRYQITVLEVKGPEVALPLALRYLKRLEPTWLGFSKYRRCVEAHDEREGSFGWLRP